MALKTAKSSFVKQAAILAAAGILVRILGFVYRVQLTNNLIGDEGNGVYSIGHTIYNFFLIMSSAGLPAAISKMVSERAAKGRPDEAHRVFKIAMILSASLGFVFMLIILFNSRFIVEIFDSPRSYYALMTLAPTVLIVAIISVFRGYFQGLQTTVPTALSQVVEQIFNAAFSIFLAYIFMKSATPVSEGGDPIALGAAGGTAGTGVGALAALLLLIVFYYIIRPVLFRNIRRAEHKKSFQSAKSITVEILKISVPIIAGTAVFSISNMIDNAMVKNRLLAAGILEAGMRDAMLGQLAGKFTTITTLPVAISSALAAAAIPSIVTSVVKKDKKAVNEKINTSMRIAMIISFPAAVGIGVLADQILLLLYPNTPGGGILLQVGAVSIVFLALTLIVTGMLQGIGRLSIPVIGAVCGALVKIPLNYFLIANPNIQIVGAVISTSICYLISASINWYFLHKQTRAKPDFVGILAKPAFASAIMGLACYASYYIIYYIIPSNAIGTIFSILVSIAVYFTILLLIGGMRKNDIALMPMGDKIIAALERFNLI